MKLSNNGWWKKRKQWKGKSEWINFSLWMELCRLSRFRFFCSSTKWNETRKANVKWNGALLGCLFHSLWWVMGQRPLCRTRTSLNQSHQLISLVLLAPSNSIAPAKTGSPNLFLSSLMSEIKGREWFVCWPAAHNQLSSAASGMKKQTHSLQQIKICLREWKATQLVFPLHSLSFRLLSKKWTAAPAGREKDKIYYNSTVVDQWIIKLP